MDDSTTVNISLGQLATRWERLGASLLDLILIYIICFIIGFFGALALQLSGQAVNTGVFFWIGFGFPYLIYYPVTTILWKATPGKLALKIKVVSDNFEALTPGRIYFRESVGRLIGSCLFGAIWIFFNKKNKTAWDLFAKSLVIKA